MDNNYEKLPGYTKYLDLNHQYFIVTTEDKKLENNLYDCDFWDNKKNTFKPGFQGMYFDERQYLLMEQYLFNFIDSECNLIITMYEEEFAPPEILPQIIEVTKRMINNCDDDEFIGLANKFLVIINIALDNNSVVGFCF